MVTSCAAKRESRSVCRAHPAVSRALLSCDYYYSTSFAVYIIHAVSFAVYIIHAVYIMHALYDAKP